jgi:hypothetical protein
MIRSIAIKLKDHDCEKMIKSIRNGITLTLPTGDAEGTKLNIGLFSNKIMEQINAFNTAASLDNVQYLLCKVRNSTSDPTLKLKCEKFRILIILELTRLQSIFETIKIDPRQEIGKDLTKWIKYSAALNLHAQEICNRRIPYKGPAPFIDFELEDIMKYQNITENELKEALNELKY